MKGFGKAQGKGSPLNYFCMFCNASNNSTVNILVLGIARKAEWRAENEDVGNKVGHFGNFPVST